jgi:hypothetical protein
MPNTNESQCYFVQLQIDSYLDGGLAQAQQQEFMSHVRQCAACAREFQFAQSVHDTVMDFAAVDCDEAVMEPIHRLAAGQGESPKNPASGFNWGALGDFFNSTPLVLRFGFATAIVAVVAVALSTSTLLPQQQAPILAEQSTEPVPTLEYTPAEIIQAVQDLNLAMEYLNDLGQRTEVLIGERFLVTPLQESLNASFERAASRNDFPIPNDPI